MKEIENLKEKIMKDYQRLSLEDTFVFGCHPGVPCFNNCCRDVNIFLTPYDILRLKNRLKISSQDFLDKYTLLPFDVHQTHPVVLLKMDSNEQKTCPFITEAGCSVYSDRPWSCRMYPLGKASPTGNNGNSTEGFYFILEEEVCKGFNASKKWTIGEWLENQHLEDYDIECEKFKEISLHKFFMLGKALNPQKMEMFHLVCYNIDKFRKFIFESSFRSRFEISRELAEKLRTDDYELLKFGYDWLKFSLFEEMPETIKIKKS